MAKVTALTEITAPANGDFLYIVDISDTTDDPTGSSRKIQHVNIVPAGSVSNAKLANVATATIKGRISAGTGSPEDLTVTQAKALLNIFPAYFGDGTTGRPLTADFPDVGRFVSNTNTSSGQSVGWYVKSAGSLAPAWTASTAGIVVGNLRANAGNVYIATTAGTTGTIAPTGTGTNINDGGILWNFHAAVAVIMDSSEVYP